MFFAWDSTLAAFPAALVAAFVDTLTILMIVFGALFLHQSMEQGGFIVQIKNGLQGAHGDPSFQFYFLAFFLTAFFESVAGFGTPGAIVPLLLIPLGFSPVLAISVVLLLNGLMAVSGALGTPVTAGFVNPLGLSTEQTKWIYLYASIFMVVAGTIVVYFIDRNTRKERPTGTYAWKIYAALALPFVGLSYFLQELTGVVSAVILAAFGLAFFFTSRRMDGRPWIPYVFLISILLLPKIFPSLANFLSTPISFTHLFGTEVRTSLQPLRSPLLPFILAAILAAALSGKRSIPLAPVVKKTFAVFVVLLPSLMITRLMMASGSADTPSMVATMSSVFAGAGGAYPVLSPLIGTLGTFITGSTTVSNIIFGPVQFAAAEQLSLSQEVVLAMQLNGAVLGNAICLFNIIAAAAVAGVDRYTEILNRNIVPVVLAALATGLMGLGLLSMVG